MPSTRTYQQSFGGGEIGPEVYGRLDDAKRQAGAALMRNFIALAHGPAANRPGFAFVREVRTSSQRVRVIPFSFSASQTFAIELGAGYFRFHTNGATVLSGASPYEISNPYVEADLFDIHYVQSADVLTLVHPNYAPRELRRLGATNWQLAVISFGPSLGNPTDVAATATQAPSPNNLRTYSYAVTAVAANVQDESANAIGVSTNIPNNLFQTGAFNTITWNSVAGASRYRVYKETNGVYGFIGETTALSFRDDNITADISKTLPEGTNPFASTGNYPAAVTYFEQRRCFAGTLNQPQTLWMTRSGTESSLNFSVPTRSDDAITFRVAARELNSIRHLVPLQTLILLTNAAEWRVTSVNSDAITPTSVSVRPQSYIGANNVQPVLVNNTIIYAAARGGRVREQAYSDEAGGYITGDLCLRSSHLFDGLNIVDMAYVKSPQSVLWFVSSSGKLLGFTYVPEQQVGGWHQHDTDGVFESVAAVAEGNEDAVYCVVRRTINGQSRRYVERMASRLFADPADAFFVDCGATYSGAPATTISGLAHLEGKTVSILADGAVHPQRQVQGGQITLEQPSSKVQVGLPITADLQTLPLAVSMEGYGQGRQKNINKAWLRVVRSSGIFTGPAPDRLVEAKQRTTEPYGSPPGLKTEEIEIVQRGQWDDGGQLWVRQADPLPLTVVALTLEVAIGG